jgi:hypothetical protein
MQLLEQLCVACSLNWDNGILAQNIVQCAQSKQPLFGVWALWAQSGLQEGICVGHAKIFFYSQPPLIK